VLDRQLRRCPDDGADTVSGIECEPGEVLAGLSGRAEHEQVLSRCHPPNLGND